MTGGSVIEGAHQESTFYSMNQSIDDGEKRGGTTPLTQIESIYCKQDPLRVGVRNAADRHGTNLGSQPRKGRKMQKFTKMLRNNQMKDMMFVYNDGKQLYSERGSNTKNYKDVNS